jgi:hypothetical protein
LLAAANWQTVMLGVAMLMAEGRPALLSDAAWNDPASARRFNSRFHSGVPESELVAWLNRNKFTTGVPGHASRSIASLPCNEQAEIAWSSRSDGTIAAASARLSEAGCL